jgi:hypothetical protein
VPGNRHRVDAASGVLFAQARRCQRFLPARGSSTNCFDFIIPVLIGQFCDAVSELGFHPVEFETVRRSNAQLAFFESSGTRGLIQALYCCGGSSCSSWDEQACQKFSMNDLY